MAPSTYTAFGGQVENTNNEIYDEGPERSGQCRCGGFLMPEWVKRRRRIAELSRDREDLAPQELQELVDLESEMIQRQAKRWGADIPQEFWVTADDDGHYFIGALYHEQMRLRNRLARRQTLQFWVWWIAPIGGILGIVSFLRACSN